MTKKRSTNFAIARKEEAIAIMQEAGLQPLVSYPGSGKPWKSKCKKCKQIVSPTLHNVKRGTRCRYCAVSDRGHAKNNKFDEILSIRLRKNGLLVLKVIHGPRPKVQIRCSKCGWSSTIRRDTALGGASCRRCTNTLKALEVGVNDLKSQFPLIANEADGWDPSAVARGSSRSMPWKCSEGHTWAMPVTSRTLQKQGCPYCAGQRVWPGFNDLETTHPNLARQIVATDPTTVAKGTKGKVQWRCDSHGHLYMATVSHRREGKGCPFCSGNQILIGFNDFATTHPNLAKESVTDPTTFSKGTNKKVKWVCSSGHRYEMNPSNRLNGENCPICVGREILSGFNDLATTHPSIAGEAFGWDPTTVGKGHATKLSWRCSEGHTWHVSPNQRTSTSSGCPYCSGKLAIEGKSDLATTHPQLISEIAGWDPRQVKAGSKVKRSWRCALGHTYSMSPHLRTFQHSGCPYCSNTRILAGFNDLATRYPEVAREAFGWDPSTVLSQSGKRRKFRCHEGHVWTARIADRTSKGAGCPTCAKSGFDPNEPGFLYFLRDDIRQLFQIGITNDPHRRLSTHEKNGWEVIDVRGPMDGHTARELETKLLGQLRARGAKFANKRDFEKFDGWSESWVQSTFRISLISELLAILH